MDAAVPSKPGSAPATPPPNGTGPYCCREDRISMPARVVVGGRSPIFMRWRPNDRTLPIGVANDVGTTVAFWSWLRRLFDVRTARRRPSPRNRRTSGRGLASHASYPMATESEFDIHQGADYGSHDRVRLSDGDRLRLAPLKDRVAAVFHADKGEIAAFPSRAAHILRILDEPGFDIGQLVVITQRDPAISAS